jgi:hypothetical protein
MSKLYNDIRDFEVWQQMEAMRDYADENRISLIEAKYTDKGKCGIHVIEPTPGELRDAIEDAAVKGFDTIYLHTKLQFELQLIRGGK